MNWLRRLERLFKQHNLPKPLAPGEPLPPWYGVANLPHHTAKFDHEPIQFFLPPYESGELPPVQLQHEIRRRLAESHDERMYMYELHDELAAGHIYTEEAIQNMIDATHPENAKPPWEDDDE